MPMVVPTYHQGERAEAGSEGSWNRMGTETVRTGTKLGLGL